MEKQRQLLQSLDGRFHRVILLFRKLSINVLQITSCDYKSPYSLEGMENKSLRLLLDNLMWYRIDMCSQINCNKRHVLLSSVERILPQVLRCFHRFLVCCAWEEEEEEQYVIDMRTIRLLLLSVSAVILVDGQNPHFPDCLSGPLTTFPICNQSLPNRARAADIVSRMNTTEKISRMASGSISIPRLGLPPFTWGSEALRGCFLQ